MTKDVFVTVDSSQLPFWTILKAFLTHTVWF